MSAVQLFPQFQAMMLKALPKVVQGLFAASGDFYTWRLAEKIYGEGSNTAWVAVCLSEIFLIFIADIHLASHVILQPLAMVLLD